MFGRIALLVLAVFCVGGYCMTDAGKRVKYVLNDANRFSGCQRLADLRETADSSGGQEDARDKLRDEAARLGATHINLVWSDQTAWTRIVSVNAVAYKCANDVGGEQ